MGFAASRGMNRHRPGPKDPALRKARVCYNHLAGDYGVRMYDSLIAEKQIEVTGDDLALTPDGQNRIEALGIDYAALKNPAARSAAPASTGASAARIWPVRLAKRC